MLVACSAVIQAKPSVVILQYHHVGEDTPPSTTISTAQFRQHMAFLQQHYQVWPLDKVIETLTTDTEVLPDNVVAITFDDGYINILQNADPILKEYQFPYTIFINPDEIGQRTNQLNWQQVKSLSSQKVLFANHTNDHLHLLQRQAAESHSAWLNRVTSNIVDAEAKLLQQLGYSLKYLAYPYGEYNSALQKWVKQSGYIGFGQQSGAISGDSDFTALPRYPAAGIYASLDSLKVKLASLAMPVEHSNVQDPQFNAGDTYPQLELQVSTVDFNPALFACFLKGKPLEVNWNKNTVQVGVDQVIPIGRTRINCTVPSNTHKGHYYWYSQPFFVADKNGNWLN
ncbi:polysaccharide deacetylase family protein [Neptunicella sp.]|uniref:polysaccharide deacetylase family protein n=1 Tax=Neptunicella sp. TaxID=2125986 RepID=UPI003F68CBFE